MSGRGGPEGGYLEDMIILDVMDDHILAPGRYPENFVLISLLEVCHKRGCQEGVLPECEGS